MMTSRSEAMNTQDKNSKLKELEARQREIADEIAKLRCVEERRPEAGDVYIIEDQMVVLDHNDSNIILREYVDDKFLLGHYAHDEGHRIGAFIGKFHDVFITKKRVAEVIASEQDMFGDYLFDERGFVGDCCCNLTDALAAVGITKELAQ